MTSPSVTRVKAVAALVALVGLISFASFSPAAPAWSSAAGGWIVGSSSDATVPLARVIAGAHPDVVGVAERRPVTNAALVLTGPMVAWSFVVALAAVGIVVLLGRSTAAGARLRRWRARLVGAPPLAS